ncbi:MAG TPA: hypothetical protein PKE45_07970, partial [Caldilineaceae bacterium]|nr:hypothetical protein [Caldilineaceae bacterium]
MYDLSFTCAVSDRYLDEATFSCPAGGAPVRRFDNNPDIQALFPDRTIVNGLTVSAAYWWPDPNVAITVSACDAYGNCASSSQPLPPAGGSQVASASGMVSSAAASSLQSPVSIAAGPGAPFAVVIAPTAGSFVAADGDIPVGIAAEAGALLKEVTVYLDNNLVQTLSFAQDENATRILRTVNLSGISEGQHTLVARATDWANATQSTEYPVTFTLDR